MIAASFWLPEDLSLDGHRIDFLISIVHWFMAVLFVGWGIFFVYCLIRFRQRTEHCATYELIKAKPSKYAEVAVVVIEAVLLIAFSMPVWAAFRNEPPAPDKNPLTVRVVAQQFAWNIHYPGPDGKFGRTSPEYNDEVTNPIGLDPNDPAGQDDVTTINQLHIPLGRPVIARLSSKDVIHSFAIPVLRVKQDVIPGMELPIWFTATSRGEKDGVYDIHCAQLCGLGHYRMKGQVNIHEPADFEEWYASAGEEEEFFEED